MGELIHAPSEPDIRSLQKVHDELFSDASPPYAGFQTVPGGAMLANPAPGPGVVSQVAFLADRVQFREERTAMTPEEFGPRMRQVLEVAAPRRGIRQLLLCQVVLRCLINPRHWTDTRELFRQGMLGQEGLASFGRDPGIYGARLSFPARQGESDPPIELRVESFLQDPRSLFVEVQSAGGSLHLPEGLDQLEAHVLSTYEFLTQRVVSFIGHLDSRSPR